MSRCNCVSDVVLGKTEQAVWEVGFVLVRIYGMWLQYLLVIGGREVPSVLGANNNKEVIP